MAFDMEKLIRSISALSVILFLAGGFLGIYNRWQHHSSDKGFVIFGIIVAIFYCLSLALYFFEYRKLARGIVNLPTGIIFNVLTFTSVAYDHLFVSVQHLDFVDMLLIGSTFIHCLGILVERIHNYGNIEFQPLTSKEILLLVGFACGSLVSEHGGPTILLTVAVACNLVGVHLKSALSLVNALMTSLLVAMEFFPALKVQYNPFCLLSFATWLSFEAIIDLYFSKYSTVDRWKGFLTCEKWHRKSFVVLVFLCECIYVACAAQVTMNHNRFVAIATIFMFFLFWIPGHTVFFVDCWGFLIKLEECSSSLKEEFDTNTMLDVLASRGVRHFCLISKSIVLLSVATTLLLAIPSWQVTNAWFISSFLLVMPIESMVYSVLSSLGQLLSLWEELNGETGARLILTLDTESSYQWLPEVKKLKKHFVAVQVGELQDVGDIETATMPSVGELTKLLVHFNSSFDNTKAGIKDVSSDESKIRPTYAVSWSWCDFKFHVPTQKDVSHHIEESFPAIVQPIMRFWNKIPQRPDLFCLCEDCVALARKLKMQCLPPLTLDTGHGFKLIRKLNS